MGTQEERLAKMQEVLGDGLHKRVALFDAWWFQTGHPLVCRMALYPSAPLLKDLCEIAYYQGRLDENTKHAEQTREHLTRLTQPPPD